MKARLRLANLLRHTHLLPLADYVLFRLNILKNKDSNSRFMREHPGFVPPPVHLAYDAYNHTDWRVYFEIGKKHADIIADLVNEHIRAGEIHVCEWGCGPARVIQHLVNLPKYTKVHLLGTDYNKETIAWCQRHVKGIEFIPNRLEPPLSIGSSTLDCVYAISVFTHLSKEMHYLWIDELFRVLKPGGLLIFTTHGDLCADRLLGSQRAQYDAGDLVAIGKVKEGKKHFSTYHPSRFVENELLKGHAVVKHFNVPEQYKLIQDVWAVRKSGANEKKDSPGFRQQSL
jgi:SAM-dependent methyltransferase